MEAIISYSACTLKPNKRARRGNITGDGQDQGQNQDQDQDQDQDKDQIQDTEDKPVKLGLSMWKKVEALRYRCEASGENAPLSMVAFGRDGRQARLYSLHHGAVLNAVGSGKSSSFKLLRRKQKEAGVVRKKTKIAKAALVSLSESGQFAVVSSVAESLIRVYDLSSPEHRVVLQIAFPEAAAARSARGKVPAPQHVAVSDDGRRIVSQSKSQGTLWLYDGSRGEWEVLVTHANSLARSVDVRFQDFRRSASRVECVCIKRIFAARSSPSSLTDVKLTLEFTQLSRNEDIAGAFTVRAASSRSLMLPLNQHAIQLPGSGETDDVVETVLQCWASHRCVPKTNSTNRQPPQGSSLASGIAVNFAAQTKTQPVVVMHDPFGGDVATVTKIGKAAAHGEGVRCCDLAWTHENAFLALTFSDGSLCLIASSGEPIRLVRPAGSTVRRRARIRLTFRHLEHYEKQGKVPSHFGVACHPSKPELTWCDGNRNLVHVKLPKRITSTNKNDKNSLTAENDPYVLAHASVALTSLGSGNDLSATTFPQLMPLDRITVRHTDGNSSGHAAQRAVLGWAMCMTLPPLGWTHGERLAARVCARAVTRGALFELLHFSAGSAGGREVGVLRVFAHALNASRRDFRNGAELAFAVRTLVGELISRGAFYAALHVLRMAEAHFHKSAGAAEETTIAAGLATVNVTSAHLAVCSDVTFDRFWLLIGASALKSSKTMSSGSNRALGAAALGYAQQRARSWARMRADENLVRAGDLRLSLAKGDGVLDVRHEVVAAWAGHDCFLRGRYDDAEAAYATDKVGAFPLMCLLLRRYKLSKAVRTACEWQRLPPKQRQAKRPAFGLLGRMLAGTLLNRPNLVAVPSPLANPTNRSVRFLDLAKLNAALVDVREAEQKQENFDPDSIEALPRIVFVAAFCLLMDGQAELAGELLGTAADSASVSQLMAEQPDLWRFVEPKPRALVLQRHIAVLLSLGSTFAPVLATAAAHYEPDARVRQSVLWVVLTHLENAQVAQVSSFWQLVTARSNAHVGTRNHPLVLLGRAALKLMRSADSDPSWKPLLFQHGSLSDWLLLLRALVLLLWKSSSLDNRHKGCVVPLAAFIRSRGASDYDLVIKALTEAQSDALLSQIVDAILAEKNKWPAVNHRLHDELQDNEEAKKSKAKMLVQTLDPLDALAAQESLDSLGSPAAPRSERALFPNTQLELPLSALPLSDEEEFPRKELAQNREKEKKSTQVGDSQHMGIKLPNSLLSLDDSDSDSDVELLINKTGSQSPVVSPGDIAAENVKLCQVAEASIVQDEKMIGDSESDSESVEYESPWIFKQQPQVPPLKSRTSKKEDRYTSGAAVAQAIRDQNERIEVALNKLHEKQEASLRQLSDAIAHIAHAKPQHLVVPYQSSDSDSENDGNNMGFDEEYEREHEHAKDLGELSSHAAQRFLAFAGKSSLARPVAPPKPKLNQSRDVYVSPVAAAAAVERDQILAGIVPRIPGVPRLLELHPVTKRTADAHRFRQSSMSTDESTQTGPAVVEKPASPNLPMTSPVANAYLVKPASPSGFNFQPNPLLKPPLSPPSPPPPHSPAPTKLKQQQRLVDAIKLESMHPKPRTNVAHVRDTRVHIPVEPYPFNPLPTLRHAPSQPDLYLSLQADGHRLRYFAANQHNMRSFVAVADIKPAAVANWRIASPVEIRNRRDPARPQFLGQGIV